MENKPTYEELEQRVKELAEETAKRKQAEDALRGSGRTVLVKYVYLIFLVMSFLVN